MQITFIVNSKINKLKTVLQEIGNTFYDDSAFKTTILQTHSSGHAIELAKDATQKGTDYLIAVGESADEINKKTIGPLINIAKEKGILTDKTFPPDRFRRPPHRHHYRSRCRSGHRLGR